MDKTRFIEKYLEELKDLTGLLEKETIQFKQDPKNLEKLSSILRSLHTIKGSSRMMGFLNIEKMSHALETVWKGIKEERYPFHERIKELNFIACDFFVELIIIVKETSQDDFEKISAFIDVCEKVYSTEPFDLTVLKEQKLEVLQDVPKLETSDSSIRVDTSLIDDIVKYVNMLLIKQLYTRKHFEMLIQLEDSINEIYVKNHKNSQIVIERNILTTFLKDIRKLYTNLMDDSSELETSTYDLQDKIISLRMLPLNLILDSFPRMVDEISSFLSKQIQLEISGANIRIDKTILEMIKDPLIHIIRNSIDHGIESPEIRVQKGKPVFGKISIQCVSDGGHVIITISDDGKGLDYELVRLKAIELNLGQKEDILNMDSNQLNQFIFLSNFTTKQSSTEISGRGIGLDIVRRNIEEIKGKISIHSEKDKGINFTISLPSSLSTVDGFFILASEKKFLVPSHFIKETILVQESELIKMMNKIVYNYRSELISIYELSSILDLPSIKQEKVRYLMILDNMGETIGMCVDSTISYNTLVSKSLPSNMSKLKSLQGIVFDENYNMIPILFIPEIINRFKRMKSIDTKKKFIQKKKLEKTILVVDDSLNTREIEKTMLESEHYTVLTAFDGLDGLDKIRSKKIDLIVTDINMPRMDGFTFVENVRKEEQYKNIPIIMISSMHEPEVKQRAFQSGVTEYIIKSQFDQNDLISAVKKQIGEVR